MSDKQERDKFISNLTNKQCKEKLIQPQLKIKSKDYTEKWVELKI